MILVKCRHDNAPDAFLASCSGSGFVIHPTLHSLVKSCHVPCAQHFPVSSIESDLPSYDQTHILHLNFDSFKARLVLLFPVLVQNSHPVSKGWLLNFTLHTKPFRLIPNKLEVQPRQQPNAGTANTHVHQLSFFPVSLVESVGVHCRLFAAPFSARDTPIPPRGKPRSPPAKACL